MSCSTDLQSISTGCPNKTLKSVSRVMFTPPLDGDGLPPEVADLATFTLSEVNTYVNNSDPLTRWYPSPKFSKSIPTTADPTIEESQTDSVMLGDGKTTFQCEIWGSEGADFLTKAALDKMQTFNGFPIDKNGSVLVYLDETRTKITPVPFSQVFAAFKFSDIENTQGQKIIVTFTLDVDIDFERLVVLTKDQLGFNMNSIIPLQQVGNVTSTYQTPAVDSMTVYISDVRPYTPITGLTTSDVTGAIVGGAALTSLTVAPDAELGAGYYKLSFTAIPTGSTIQLTWSKTGYIFDDLNTKVSPAVPV